MDSTDIEVADGVRLRVLTWPGPNVAPFLLVHGLSSNARLWEGVGRALNAAGHAVYAVDLRSHGESTRAAAGHDTGTAAADVARVASALELAPAVVVGQSWGGNVVVRLAARHPEVVAALALVDGGWIDLSAEFDSWEACEAQLRPPAVDGRPAAEIRGYFTHAHPDWSVDAIEASLANLRTTADGLVERRLPILDHMRIVRSMWDEPPWPDLERIAVPTLLLPAVSTEPTAAAARQAQVAKAAKALAQARIREYVGGDHDLHAQHPDSIAADLLTLVDELPPQG